MQELAFRTSAGCKECESLHFAPLPDVKNARAFFSGSDRSEEKRITFFVYETRTKKKGLLFFVY
jgi:hypothetical protein